MKGMKKRGLCLALSLYIVAGSATNSYASASIVIGGGTAVAVEYAFAWLLGAVGLTAASAIVYENADSIKAWGAQQNREFCQWVQANADAYNEWADVTEDKINAWCDRVAKGTIDKGSSVWQAFKDWASSIYVRSTNPPVFEGYLEMSELTQYIDENMYWGNPPHNLPKYIVSRMTTDKYWRISSVDGSARNWTYDFWDSETTLIYNIGYSYVSLSMPTPAKYGYLNFTLGDDDSVRGRTFEGTSSTVIQDSYNYYGYWFSPSISIQIGQDSYSPDLSGEEEYVYVGGASDVFDRDGSLDNLDLVGTGSAADVTDVPVVWTGDDALADILAGVAAGTDSWAQVLENAGVVVVDRIGDTVVDDEGVTDEPIAGVVPMPPPSVPSEIKDYTVDGLSDLFPFCLPFDLIDFLGIFVAEPEAPNFTWTFSYPSLDGMKTYDFEIDLSPFNSVAQLLRDLECILFVVGLILITRDQMIKG